MPDDLTPLPPSSALASKPTWPTLSEELRWRLASTTTDHARQIGHSPALRAELETALPAMKTFAMRKAGKDGVESVIGRRFVLFPQPERRPEEWAAWWADYQAVLADLPMEALETAMVSYVAGPDADFLPKPGRLRELAQTVPTKSAMLCHRAGIALSYRDEPPRTWAEPEPSGPTEADKAAIKRMAAEVRAALTKPPAFGGYEWRQAKTDEHGLTAEMRKALARQQDQRA